MSCLPNLLVTLSGSDGKQRDTSEGKPKNAIRPSVYTVMMINPLHLWRGELVEKEKKAQFPIPLLAPSAHSLAGES